MGIGLLIDFMLEVTFGIAFDTVSHRFTSFRDFSAVKTMNLKQKEAFLQAILLVMMADGGLSLEEQTALESKLQRLQNPEVALAMVERIRRRTSEALHEGRANALVDELLAALSEKSHQRAMVNFAWEVHRIDDHHVEDKMDILHRFCKETGIFPSVIE